MAAPSSSPILSLSLLSLPAVIGLQENGGTSIPICSYSLFSNLISGAQWTLAPLYMHFQVSELEEPPDKSPSIRSPSQRAHRCSVCVCVLSSPLILPVSQQSQRIMRRISEIAPFACDDDERISS